MIGNRSIDTFVKQRQLDRRTVEVAEQTPGKRDAPTKIVYAAIEPSTVSTPKGERPVTNGSLKQQQNFAFVLTSNESALIVVHLPNNEIKISQLAPRVQSGGQVPSDSGSNQPVVQSGSAQNTAGMATTSSSVQGSTTVSSASSDGYADKSSLPSDGTRAMTLAPITLDESALTAFIPANASGDPVPTQNGVAALEWSGGAVGGPALMEGTTDGKPNGHYTASTPVPIGFLANILSGNPYVGDPWNAVTWSGGTNYDGYIQSAYTDAAPGVVNEPKKPSLTFDEYIFATDGQAKTYTVNFDAVTDLGSTDHADLTFTTVAPSQATIADPVNQNPPTGYAEASNGGINYTLRLGKDQATFATQAGAGVYISATTETNPQFGGDFAFFQTTDSQSYATVTDPNGGLHYYKAVNIGAGHNLDSQGGPDLLGHTIEGTYANTPPVTGWTLAKGQGPVIHWMIDSPAVSQGISNLVTESAGIALAPAGGAAPAPNPTKFLTYLMYKGDTWPTVWVALQKASWQWTAKKLSQNGS